MEERSIFKENQERMRNRRQEQLRKLKREQIKETILASFIGGFIIIAFVMLIANMNNKQMENCTKAGHSVSYCERGL